jgi:dTDP-4-dehydrorhamnose reductase
MKKILIIGSKGMLGQELVDVFKKDSDYKIIAWDKEDIDITREKEVDKKIGFIKPNIVINAAAYNAVDKCEENKNEYEIARKVNGLAPGYLAKSAKKAKAVLVQYSSDYVFGQMPEMPEPKGCTHMCSTCGLHEEFQPQIGFYEDDKPKPGCKYAETKLMGEKEVEKNHKNYYIIRLSKLFGKPASSEHAKKGFFDIMLEFGKKGEVRKLVDEETSCFTYAPDLAKKTKEIIDSKKPFGIYHVTNGGPCTWYEACQELYKLAKIKTKIILITGEEYPRPAKRPPYSVLLNTKLNPLRDWKEALKEYVKIIKT